MKQMILGLMLALPLSGCHNHKSNHTSEAKATEPSASMVPQALVPPESMFRFLDNVIAKVLAINPGSDTLSAGDLKTIDAAELQESAKAAQLDLSQLQNMTNYLSPEAKAKIASYVDSQHLDLDANSTTKTLKKSDISASYATFKKFFGLPASDLLNSKTVVESKEFSPAKIGSAGLNIVGVDDIILSALALGVLVFYVIPAVIVLIVAVTVLSPILSPLFTLLELLVLFAISFGGLI